MSAGLVSDERCAALEELLAVAGTGAAERQRPDAGNSRPTLLPGSLEAIEVCPKLRYSFSKLLERRPPKDFFVRGNQAHQSDAVLFSDVSDGDGFVDVE